MSLRSIGRALVVTGLLIALPAAAFSAWLAWRLSAGPLPLPFLDPYAAQALSNLGADLNVSIDRTVLLWPIGGILPEIHVLDVRLTRRSDGTIAGTLPELSARPSARALLRGRLAIAAIGLSGIRLALTRSVDGSLTFGKAASDETEGKATLPLDTLVAALRAEGTNGYLARIRLHDAEIVLIDRLLQSTWKATRAALDIRRRGGEIVGEMRADLSTTALGGGQPHAVFLPLTATARVKIYANGEQGGLEFVVKGKEGRLTAAAGAHEPLAVRSLDAEGSLSADARTLELRRLRTSIGDATLESSARLSFGESGPDLELRGEIRDLPVADLAVFWPMTQASAARAWVVDNVRDGAVQNARFTIRLPDAAARAGHAAAGLFRVDFGFEGLTVDYFSPLRPLADVHGAATLTEKKLEVRVAGGQAGQLHVRQGSMDLDLSSTPPSAAITIDVAGPSEDLLAWLDEPPLGYPGRIGLAAMSLAGESGAHAEFRLPLRSGLSASELQVDVTATIGDREGAGATIAAEVSDAALQKLTVERLKVGGNDLAAEVARGPDGRYRVALNGESLDLTPLLERLRHGGDTPLSSAPPYEIDFRLARASAGGGLDLANLHGRMASDGTRLQEMRADGAFAGGGDLHVALDAASGHRRLELRSDQAGKALRALGVFENASGGRLSLDAVLGEESARTRTEGTLDVSDVRVANAPVLAHILSVGSLEGAADMMRGEGITFTRARFPFLWSNGVIEVNGGRAVGALGLTAEGTIDRTGDRIDLHGEVIPAYTLNWALGKVPVIGEFLTGGQGKEGIFGISYRVSGKLEEPDVRVNPLSLLAPRVLREMFVDPFGQETRRARPAQ